MPCEVGFGRSHSKSGRSRVVFVEAGPNVRSTNVWPTLTFRPKLGSIRPKLGRRRPKLGYSRPHLGHVRPMFGQNWPNSTMFLPSSANIVPKAAKDLDSGAWKETWSGRVLRNAANLVRGWLEIERRRIRSPCSTWTACAFLQRLWASTQPGVDARATNVAAPPHADGAPRGQEMSQVSELTAAKALSGALPRTDEGRGDRIGPIRTHISGRPTPCKFGRGLGAKTPVVLRPARIVRAYSRLGD